MSAKQTTINESATIRFHESHKTPPILDPGHVTPAVVMEFQEYATAFFIKTKMPEDEQVISLLTSFRVANWAKMNKDCFCAPGFTFTMFMNELHKHFLPPFWENQLFWNVINSKMLSSESFSTFADRVIAGNNLLEGSKFRLSIEQLRETLMSNMGEYLDSKWQNLKQAERKRIKAIGIFDDWLLEIVTMDSQANDDLKRVADMAAENVAKRQRLNYDPSPYLSGDW